MRPGKLNGQELNDYVFSEISHRRAEVVSSCALGADCARITLGGDLLVHTDPITGETANAGSLAIKVSANDVIAGGGEPIAFLLTVILPDSATLDDVKRIMRDAEREARNWNAEIVGGHTEFSTAVMRPVVNAVALGKAIEGWVAHEPKVGDDIIVTKTLAIEGTVLLADAYARTLSLTEGELAELEKLRASTDILKEGAVIKSSGIPVNIHDVTEGGIYGAVYELCQGRGLGAEIYADKVPFAALTLKVCAALGADPYRLISSGSMLVITDRGAELTEKFCRAGIAATVVGRITDGDVVAGYSDGDWRKIEMQRDELFRYEGDTDNG